MTLSAQTSDVKCVLNTENITNRGASLSIYNHMTNGGLPGLMRRTGQLSRASGPHKCVYEHPDRKNEKT